MTQISYIHGLGQRKDIPKKTAPQRAINYQRMTAGELRLALLAEQMGILNAYYGEEEYKKAEQKLINTLRQGLHGMSNPSNIGANGGQVMRLMARQITKAKRMIKPAAGILFREIHTGINNPLIPLEDCSKVFDEAMKLDLPTVEKYKNAARLVDECVRQNNQAKIINENLENGAHHLLYEFLTSDLSNPRAQTKSVLHRNALSSLGDITSLDRENLRLWIRNGVMRNNAAQGIDPFQPEKTIHILKTEIPDRSEVSGAFLLALPKILLAVGSAIAATATLIGALDQAKKQQIQSAAAGIGTPTFGPEESDWTVGAGSGSSDNMLPLGLAAVAYFMFS